MRRGAASLLAASAKGAMLGAGLAALAGGAAAAQDAASSAALGWISLEPSAAGVVIVGHALAFAAGEVDATMTVSRSGKAGTSRTRQSDRVTLAAGGAATLSRTALSFAPGDRLDVELELSRGGHVLSRSRLDSGG
jgi:hypothetical protein